MGKFKPGYKVRIRRDLHEDDYGDCYATIQMCSHAGKVVTIDEYHASNMFTIKEALEGCSPTWCWSDEMMEGLAEPKSYKKPEPTKATTMYKVGDRVRVISEIPKDKTAFYMEGGSWKDSINDQMEQFLGEIVTISEIVKPAPRYRISEDEGRWNWTDEMFEGLAEEPKKQWTKKNPHISEPQDEYDLGWKNALF